MIKILSKSEKQEIINKLNEQFGISEIDGSIIKFGEERLFLFSGNLSEGDLKELEREVPIERIGLYFAKILGDEIKLSIEGVHLLKDQITKNIFEIDGKQAEDWMKGQQLDIKSGRRGFIVIKNNEDLLGCGKASEEKIGNFIPKMRRLKNKEIIW